MKRIIGLMLAVSLLLPLCACGEAEEPVPSIEPVVAERKEIPQRELDLTPTDELVVWGYSHSFDLDQVLDGYAAAHPEITIKRVVSPSIEEYRDLVLGETPEEAPDVLFIFPELFGNDEKRYPDWDARRIMDSGKLADLTPLLEENPLPVDTELYRAALEACRYRGGIYLMPWMLKFDSLFLSGQERLEELEFSSEAAESTQGFLREMIRIRPKATELGYDDLLCMPWWKKQERLFQISDLPLIDWDTGTVFPQGIQPIYDYCGAVKEFFYGQQAESNQTGNVSEMFPEMIKNRETLWYCSNAELLGGWMAIESFDRPQGYILPDWQGKRAGTLSIAVGIGSQGKNQKNAWDFIRYLFTDPEQQRIVTLYNCLEVLEQWDQYIARADEFYPTVEMNYGMAAPMSEESRAQLSELNASVETVKIESGSLYRLFQETMEPYFQDEASFATCAEALKEALVAYCEMEIG